MFSNLYAAAAFASETGVAPDGSEPIGWLAGGFTLLFCIAGVVLIWSFVRTSRRAKAQWEVIEAERAAADASGTKSDNA